MTDQALVVWALFLLTLAVSSFMVWLYTILRRMERRQKLLTKELGVKDDAT